MSSTFQRHAMGVFVSILMVWISLPACSNVDVPATAEVPTPSEELVFYNWAEYMPQSVLEAFTAEYGIPVTYQTYGSMEEAVAQLRAGKIADVVVIENNNIKALAAEGLLARIDHQKISNFKNISPNFRDLAFDPNNQYSIPYDYGTTGLLIRNDRVEFPVMRWADLWDSRLAGRIAARSLAYELIGISLLSLGYPLNSEDPVELEDALQHLIELKPSLVLMEDTTSEAADILINGEAIIMIGWGNDALSARRKNPEISYLLPEEGTLLWGESFVIPAGSPHKDTAELFLNFLLRPEISAQISNENRYATANEAAYPLITPELFRDPIIFPHAEVFVNSEWYTPLSPEGEILYNNIWKKFTAAQP